MVWCDMLAWFLYIFVFVFCFLTTSHYTGWEDLRNDMFCDVWDDVTESHESTDMRVTVWGTVCCDTVGQREVV